MYEYTENAIYVFRGHNNVYLEVFNDGKVTRIEIEKSLALNVGNKIIELANELEE